jgi:hypothetical protein
MLVLILSIPTISTAYLLTANDMRSTPTSSSTSTVSVYPTNTTVYGEIGKTFTVNITITNANDLYVWQAGMTFNSTILEALSFDEGPFLKEKNTTLWTPGTIDNTAGIIHYHASALAGNVIGINGNGTLATITFKTKNYGNSTLQLTDIILLNTDLTETDKTLNHGTVKIKILGDVNGDKKVDVSDLFNFGQAYGSDSSKPNWNPDCDFNGDNKIDTSDLSDLNKNYGKTT